jgi:hypothetical protein
MKRLIRMNWFHSDYILKATSMINSLANLLRYLLMFFLKSSHVQSASMATSSWGELVVATTEELEPIKGGI